MAEAGPSQFRMPSLGADMDEGTVLEWLVKPGDTVARGDVVAVVDTSKAAIDVECFDSGVIEEILVPPGRTVPVGTPLATIGTADGARPGPAPQEPVVPAAEAPSAPGAVVEEARGRRAGGLPPTPPAAPEERLGAPAVAAGVPSTPPAAHAEPFGAPAVAAGVPSTPPAAHAGPFGAPAVAAGVPSTPPAAHAEPFGAPAVPAAGPPPAPPAAVERPGAPAVPATGTPPAPTPAQERKSAAPPAPGESHVPPAPVPKPRPVVVGPLVRKLAAELGVDLEAVRGTGRSGAITRSDVHRAAGPRKAPAPAVRVEHPSARRKVTPYARRLAGELGVDLSSLSGSGSGGVVRAADVRAARPAPVVTGKTVAPAVDRAAIARRVTAKLMARSKREIPHYYLSTTVDMSAAMARLTALNRDLPIERHVLPIALVLGACARAAAKVPQLNGFWTVDRFEAGDGVHLGMAVSLRGGGLIVPVIANAADLGPVDVMDRVRDLVTRARSGRLRGSELTGATITVTNLGDRGVESVFGVIHPPQVALVGVGKVVERPWAVGGLLGVRPVVTVTLSADHRATDGRTGARFLEIVERLLTAQEES
ncbi:2-oxo acid dehydrogenase subunit E2 [Lentzea albida]|uniref:Dihydrolipoamide acetyltransferase component of pyruvate dehydrogenase complex n=1 Tax=Lentzea albida TaxID=65499 RepID=A0A1H9RDT1_9PSEU|nr:2-oxo acid dehydrogenase subunit E2 [Lentzea albida]SER70896.1 pyruvate dehydrogenase E2 component (dihydrolipoamide acetyltransferase) [Lentzea albida]